MSRRGWHRRKWVFPQVSGGLFAEEMDPEERADKSLPCSRFVCVRHRITPQQRMDAACVDVRTTRMFDVEIWRTGARVYVGRGKSQVRDKAISRRLYEVIAYA